MSDGLEVFYLIFRKCSSLMIFDRGEDARTEVHDMPMARWLVNYQWSHSGEIESVMGDDLPTLLDQVWQKVNK